MRTLGKLSLRILAIYIFIKSFSGFVDIIIVLPQLENAGFKQSEVVSIKYYLLNFIIMLLIALLLWFYTDKIVTLIIGKEHDDEFKLDITYNQLMHIVLKVLGIIMITNAIPSVITQLINILTFNMSGFDLYAKLMMLINFLEPIIKLVIGVLLILWVKIAENKRMHIQ